MKVMVWYIYQKDIEVCQDDFKKKTKQNQTCFSGYVRRLIPFVRSVKRMGWVTVSSFVSDRFSCFLDTLWSLQLLYCFWGTVCGCLILHISHQNTVSSFLPCTSEWWFGSCLNITLVYLSKLALLGGVVVCKNEVMYWLSNNFPNSKCIPLKTLPAKRL